MPIELYQHQLDAIERLDSGKILCGGVGSGKTRASLAYFYVKEGGGALKVNGEGEYRPMTKPVDLYIITTAMKRDSGDWEQECAPFMMSTKEELNIDKIKVTIDSWNNLHKYVGVTNSFFIFDEQRVVGAGQWSKSFIKVCRSNRWILLTATPADTWMDYVPVFIANGFYKNRTEFVRTHVVYKTFRNFPIIDRYVVEHRLVKYRQAILVNMEFSKQTKAIKKIIKTQYDKSLYRTVGFDRWHPIEERPIKDITELCLLLRRVCNIDKSRFDALNDVLAKHAKVIVFYNFNYELEMLREFLKDSVSFGEWNGHKHEPIPDDKETWVYLVQYNAGAEGWNCIESDTIVFFSQNYSHKIMTQAAGRIDRLNTNFSELYYYHFVSDAPIDQGIKRALDSKKNFHEQRFVHTVMSSS